MNPIFLDIKLTRESIDMIIVALRKLPHEQVHDLVIDLVTQRNATPKPPRASKRKVAN